MKKTIILAISFLCVFTQTSFSQLPYRSLKECGNDTVKYLKYNFKDRESSDLYKGKTLVQLLSDLEIKPIGMQRCMVDANNGTHITGIILFFTQIKKPRFSDLEDENLWISWETPILYYNDTAIDKAKLSPPVKGQKKYESGSELFTAYTQEDWVPQFYDFFKDYKIKKVRYCSARY